LVRKYVANCCNSGVIGRPIARKGVPGPAPPGMAADAAAIDDVKDGDGNDDDADADNENDGNDAIPSRGRR
jgi:hypothetical protein